MQRIKRQPTWLFATLLLVTSMLSLTVVGCDSGAADDGQSSGAQEDDSIPRVQTIAVDQQDLEQKIELPGTVEGFETAELYAKVGGYLKEITVDIGDRVNKGDELARLWIPEMTKELKQKEAATAAAESEVEQAKAAIQQAEAQVTSAEAAVEEAASERQEKQAQVGFRTAEFERIEGLVKTNSLNKQMLDEVTFKKDSAQAALNAVKARVRSADAQLAVKKTGVAKAKADHKTALAHVDLAKADYGRVEALLQYGVISAPFDGVVTRRLVDPGAFIAPADGNSNAKPLMTVSRTDIVRISLQLPMAEVRWLNQGDRAVLDRINVLPDERFDGDVTRFATTLNMDSRMMRVEIDLDNPEDRLMPGYYGYVTLYLEQFPQQPVIPSSALLTDENGSYVFVVEDGTCQKRVVKTNYRDGSIVGIESGVSAGEQVIQAGGGQLVDGQKVVAVNENSGS
jgi:RND family efflux transporter MFP subunit